MTVCNSQSFISEQPVKLLLRTTAPMFGAILALLAYDLLESTLLAFQHENVLVSFGFTLPITAAMTALAIGLSIRANNKVVHRNCTDNGSLTQEISNTLVKNTVIVLFFAVVFFVFSKQLLFVTGNANWLSDANNNQHAGMQMNYMDMRYLGWVFLALVWQINAILRALGWMKLASGLMLSWALSKCILATLLLTPQSPFFIADLTALALVHLITDVIFSVISLIFLTTKVKLNKPSISAITDWPKAKQNDGLFVVIQQFITPVSMAALTAIAASIDTSYVAALALLFRLEVLFLLLPMVLTTSMPAIVGANFWLGHSDRVKQLYKLAFTTIIAFQLLVAIMACAQSYFLSSFICPHEAIAFHLENYLHWVPWGYGAAGVAIVFQSCLNAKNQTVLATLVGISHRIIFVLPLTALGAYSFNGNGFYQGLMLGHLGAIVAVIYLLKRFKLINNYNHTKDHITLEGIKHETKSVN